MFQRQILQYMERSIIVKTKCHGQVQAEAFAPWTLIMKAGDGIYNTWSDDVEVKSIGIICLEKRKKWGSHACIMWEIEQRHGLVHYYQQSL
jgi:hypothetical protein